MSRKLIITITILFSFQFVVFGLVECFWKPVEFKNHQRIRFQRSYNISLDDDGLPRNSEVVLSSFGLKEVPEVVYDFTNMTRITLAYNELEEFPYELLALPNLKEIALQNNQIRKIDFTKFKNQSVEILRLSDNEIESIEGLENLTRLINLQCDNNKLIDLPNLTGNQLERINLANNEILNFSGKIGKRIHSINLSANKIYSVDLELDGDEDLSSLDLSNNVPYLKSFPYELLDLQFLYYLNLSDCSISDFEVIETYQSNLLEMSLANNDLTKFILRKRDLRQLNTLNLSINPIAKLDIKHQNLSELNLQGTDLTENEMDINTPNLKSLDLSNNEIKALPRSILNAPNLEYLNMGYNPINDTDLNYVLKRFRRLN